jgi:hypothetical protein
VNPYGGPLKFVVPICKDCERKDKRIAELEAKLKRIEDRMKTIKAGSEPPYDNLLQRDRNTVHIVIEDLGAEACICDPRTFREQK